MNILTVIMKDGADIRDAAKSISLIPGVDGVILEDEQYRKFVGPELRRERAIELTMQKLRQLDEQE